MPETRTISLKSSTIFWMSRKREPTDHEVLSLIVKYLIDRIKKLIKHRDAIMNGRQC